MKTRTRYIVAIVAGLGVVAAVAACGHGFRHHGPENYAARHMERIAKKLALDESQTIKLSAISETLRKNREAMRAKHDEKRRALLAMLEQPTLDRQRALGLVQQSTRDINDRAPEVIAAIGDFYDSLTPAQQHTLREEVKDRMEHFGGHRWHH